MTIYGKSPYLEDQLESILNQSIKPSQIIVVEDFSNKSSKDYIENFFLTKDVPYKYVANIKNLGPAESFKKALMLSDYDLIYFSDQDDLWNKNRVAETINHHKEHFLVFCNANVFYTDSQESHKLYDEHVLEKISFSKLLLKNVLVGATLSINITGYRNIIENTSFKPMHDWVLALISNFQNKKIKFVNNELIHYRRHPNTVTGRLKNSFIKVLLFRIQLINAIISFKIQSFINKSAK